MVIYDFQCRLLGKNGKDVLFYICKNKQLHAVNIYDAYFIFEALDRFSLQNNINFLDEIVSKQ